MKVLNETLPFISSINPDIERFLRNLSKDKNMNYSEQFNSAFAYANLLI